MRRIKDSLHPLVKISDSPGRIALAFSVGVFVGFSPLLGLHTFLGIAVAFLFRLNKVATLVGAWANLPWIIVPYYSLATWVGIKLLGMPEGIYLPDIGFMDLLTREFWSWLVSQWRLLIPAFFGSTLLALILAGLAYPFSYYLVKSYRRRRER